MAAGTHFSVHLVNRELKAATTTSAKKKYKCDTNVVDPSNLGDFWSGDQYLSSF